MPKDENRIILAVDLGSQSVKVVAYSETGKSLKKSIRIIQPLPSEWGGYNYKAETFLELVVDALKEISSTSEIKTKDIAVLSFSGIGGGIVGVNDRLEPVTCFLNPLDVRDKKIISDLLVHHGDDIWEITGSSSLQSVSKILWFQQEQPEIMKKISKFLLVTHFVQSKLAGHVLDEVFEGWTTIASQGLGDTKNYTWSVELCERFNISIQKMPRVVSPMAIIGSLDKKWAEITGLPSGIPIVAGAFDKASSIVASGCMEDGSIFDETASWPCVLFVANRFLPDTKNKTITLLPSVIKGIWNGMACIKGGGLTHRWFIENFGKDLKNDAYAMCDHAAGNITPGSNGLFFIPHLQGRECPCNPDMHGAWVGISWEHKREHFYRSLLESIAYEYYKYIEIGRELLGIADKAPVRSCGGGSKSKLWCKIKADVLNRKIKILEQNDSTTMGTAIIGSVGAGLYSSIEDANKKFVCIRQEIEPEAKNVEKYKEIIKSYKKISSAIEKLYPDNK